MSYSMNYLKKNVFNSVKSAIQWIVSLNNVENNLYALLVYSAAVYCMYSTV